MKIGIIDGDLSYRKNHRFPNLACMKISGYHKNKGDDVTLIIHPEPQACTPFDHIYLSKVFTDTKVPGTLFLLDNLDYGGTGFFYDKAAPLPYEVEHSFPDYHLYDEWLAAQPKGSWQESYADCSIGYLTRGCFRKCGFCVNQNYDRVLVHSPLEEFLDPSRSKIFLLDDNFFGCPDWKRLLLELQASGKRFQFKQGLDIRLLNEEKAELLFGSKYYGDFVFAFDNMSDSAAIEEKLQLARRYTAKNLKLYVFCGFDRAGRWDDAFWERDIEELFQRIEVLMRYQALPYVTRFNRYMESPHRGMYITVARWCNQPSQFRKKSFRQFVMDEGLNHSPYRYAAAYEEQHPDISKYYDMRMADYVGARGAE